MGDVLFVTVVLMGANGRDVSYSPLAPYTDVSGPYVTILMLIMRFQCLMLKTHVASGGFSAQLTKNRTRLAASCTLADSYTCHHYKVNDGNRAADFSSEKNVLFHRRLHSEAERCLCVSGGSL